MKIINFLSILCTVYAKDYFTNSRFTNFEVEYNDNCALKEDLYISNGNCIVETQDINSEYPLYIMDTFSNSIPLCDSMENCMTYSKKYIYTDKDYNQVFDKIYDYNSPQIQENIEPFIKHVKKINNDKYGAVITENFLDGIKYAFYRAIV